MVQVYICGNCAEVRRIIFYFLKASIHRSVYAGTFKFILSTMFDTSEIRYLRRANMYMFKSQRASYIFAKTLNNGHIGIFVYYREVVLFCRQEYIAAILVGVSFI